MKKEIAVLLASVLSVGMFAGCSKATPTTVKVSDGTTSDETTTEVVESSGINYDDYLYLLDVNDQEMLSKLCNSTYDSFPNIGENVNIYAKSITENNYGKKPELWGGSFPGIHFEYSSTLADGNDSKLVKGRDIVMGIEYAGYKWDLNDDKQLCVTGFETPSSDTVTGILTVHCYSKESAEAVIDYFKQFASSKYEGTFETKSYTTRGKTVDEYIIYGDADHKDIVSEVLCIDDVERHGFYEISLHVTKLKTDISGWTPSETTVDTIVETVNDDQLEPNGTSEEPIVVTFETT